MNHPVRFTITPPYGMRFVNETGSNITIEFDASKLEELREFLIRIAEYNLPAYVKYATRGAPIATIATIAKPNDSTPNVRSIATQGMRGTGMVDVTDLLRKAEEAAARLPQEFRGAMTVGYTAPPQGPSLEDLHRDAAVKAEELRLSQMNQTAAGVIAPQPATETEISPKTNDTERPPASTLPEQLSLSVLNPLP